MKVRKLIELLEKANPEAQVRLNDKVGSPALFVCWTTTDDSMVWISSKDDVDLGYQLEARYKTGADNQEDDMSFYTDLLDHSITIKDVRELVGDAEADAMEKFCKEHHLIP